MLGKVMFMGKEIMIRHAKAGRIKTGTKILWGGHSSPLIATNIRDFRTRLFVSMYGQTEWLQVGSDVCVVRVQFGIL